jgi:single-strand DNA-binding protein
MILRCKNGGIRIGVDRNTIQLFCKFSCYKKNLLNLSKLINCSPNNKKKRNKMSANENSTITIQGLVATTPRHIITREDLAITSFRLASHTKIWDRHSARWITKDTNWFTITAFGQLAINANTSIAKGDRVVVSGVLRVRDWDNGERAGTSVEVEASSIGHDLVWGTSTFVRVSYNEDNEGNPDDEKMDLTSEVLD